MQEIADMYGVSRQCVGDAIQRAYLKSNRPPKINSIIRHQIQLYQDKLTKKKSKLDRLQQSEDIIKKEMADIEKAICDLQFSSEMIETV